MSLSDPHASRAFNTATTAELRQVLVLARRATRTFDTLKAAPTGQNALRFETTMRDLRRACYGEDA